MRFKYFTLILLFTCSAFVKAQTDTIGYIESPLQQQNIDTDDNIKTKLGVKFTLGGHTFRGSAFDNAHPLFGFGAGMYNIIDLNKKKSLKLQWELNLTFKGSKFAKPNDTSFSKISLSYFELPVYLSIKLSKNKLPAHLIVGAQLGYLFKSSITQGFGQYGEVKLNGLPFKSFDFSPAIGFRKELGSGISMQFTTKYGMVNIYTDKFDPTVDERYKGIYPVFKNGAHDVHNLSFELAFLF